MESVPINNYTIGYFFLPKADLKIANRRGLHARAASKFVKLANLYDAEITVSMDDHSVSGTSIMGLLMLAAKPGDTIIIETKGIQADKALNALTSLIDQNFEEQ